jgi:hypothetical protein
MAAEREGGEDVFLVAVAYDKHVLGRQTEGFDSERKYCGVGFAYSHYRALDYAVEVFQQVKVFKHGADIAVEVGHEYHGEACMQRLEGGTCLLDTLAGGCVAILCDAGSKWLDSVGGDVAALGKPFQLYAHLDEQEVVEVVMREDVAHAGQLTLGMNVGFAEGFLVNRDAALAVSVPDYLAPVNAAAVDCAAVVKNYSFDFSIFHLSVRR